MPADASTVRVRVPGKINLHLAVGPLRPDGYHDVTTVYQAVDLYDEVVATPSLTLEVVTPGQADVPDGPGNLAWKAATALAEHANVAPHARLTITKALPVAGGMAGGSADAAAALVACATLWNTGTSRDELAAIAATLGADVPFPLLGGTALGTGRGERLAPVLTTATFHWVVAFADFGISAGEAYAELDRLREARRIHGVTGAPDAVIDALRGGDPFRLSSELSNDLQDAAISLRPSLRRTLNAGHELGALVGLVSGSGPTCMFLTTGPDAAKRLAASLGAAGVCTSARAVSGPVPGARVIE